MLCLCSCVCVGRWVEVAHGAGFYGLVLLCSIAHTDKLSFPAAPCNYYMCAGPISGTLLLRGMPISSGKDGMVCLWDAAAPNSPIVVLEAGGPVHTMQLHEERGKQWLTSGLHLFACAVVTCMQL